MSQKQSPLPLVFDPPFMINQIVVVGMGGTGSQVARCLARMLYDRQQKRQQVPDVLFVDPDIVEPGNVGRQLFTPACVGYPKAMILARRLNMALGLNIAWLDEPLDSERHIQRGAIVCGCVDNHAARAEIARARQCLWLDSGNGYDFGQVVIGSCGDREQVLNDLSNAATRGRCHYLPHAGLLFPELLQPEPPTPEPAASCAELVTRGTQHVFINDFLGNIMAQYLYQLLNRQPVTTFATFLTLTPSVTVKSVPISLENIQAYLTPQ